MSLIRYNRMHAPGMFNLLNDIFSDDFSNSESMMRNLNMTPAVNIKETEKSFELEMAVPGMDKKDVKVEVENDFLKVSSSQENEIKEEDKNYKRREFHFSSFERAFTIPEELDGSKIEAKQENGILFISVPKKEVKPSLKKMIKVA